MTRRLAEELSARVRSDTNEMHLENAVTTEGRLTEHVKQMTAPVAGLKGENVNDNETVTDLNFELKTAKTRADEIAYRKDTLKACSQHFRRGQNRVGERSTCIVAAINRFSAGLKKGQEYMKRLSDEDVFRMLNRWGRRCPSGLLKPG